MKQHGLNLAFAERIPCGNIADRIKKPIFAQKYIAGLFFFIAQKAADQSADFLILYAGCNALIRQRFLEFGQGYDGIGCALHGMSGFQPFQRQVPSDFAYIGHEIIRTRWWDLVPCIPVSIIYAFFRILFASQDMIGHLKTQLAVFVGGFLDCLLITRKVQFDNLKILYVVHPLLFIFIKGLSPISTVFSRLVASNSKKTDDFLFPQKEGVHLAFCGFRNTFIKTGHAESAQAAGSRVRSAVCPAFSSALSGYPDRWAGRSEPRCSGGYSAFCDR